MMELTLEESLSMLMAEIAKRHDEHSNLIKEIQASMDLSLKIKKASIKALEIQVRQISIILHKKLSGNLQSSTEIKPRVNDETISTYVKADKPLIHQGGLRKFSDIGAWDDMVRIQVPRCMAWLNYNEHVDSLSTMDNKVRVTSPECTTQTLPSFEEYTPLVTYPKEVEKTLGTPIEVEPLNKTKLEEVGLNYNHNTPISFREVPSFDYPNPQLQTLPDCQPLDASLGTERGLKPPIKPQSPDSFRMKVLDNLTFHTPPSSLVASFHLRDLYCYYRPCIDDPKKHYGLKQGLLGHNGSFGVDFLKLEMIDDDWGLESKGVYFLGRGINSPIWPKEVEKI
nr:hypothetical protein [Tanacetum cinerariifolium]